MVPLWSDLMFGSEAVDVGGAVSWYSDDDGLAVVHGWRGLSSMSTRTTLRECTRPTRAFCPATFVLHRCLVSHDA